MSALSYLKHSLSKKLAPLSHNIIFWAPSCLILHIFEWKLNNWPKDKQDCMSISWIVNCLSLRGTALSCLYAICCFRAVNEESNQLNIRYNFLGFTWTCITKSSINQIKLIVFVCLLHDCRLLWMTLCRLCIQVEKCQGPSDSCIFVFCSSRGTSSA